MGHSVRLPRRWRLAHGNDGVRIESVRLRQRRLAHGIRARPEGRGQASVELALILPLVVLLLVVLVEVGLVVRDQVLVTHAAREAVRAAALEDDRSAVERAATDAGPLDPDRLEVQLAGRDGPGSRAKVEVVYDRPTRVPLIGQLVGHIRLRASASMRVEK